MRPRHSSRRPPSGKALKKRLLTRARLGCLAYLLCLPLAAEDLDTPTFLPPEAAWNGKSRELVAAPDDPWITPSEASGLTRTPRYDETIAWLERLVSASPELRMISIGTSAEGREIWMVVANTDEAFTAHDIHRKGKPLLLAQAGIHAGEIDGKDAGLMLLRDLTVKGTLSHLLDKVSLLFIPILNVDGHERFSRFGRINQRGPVEMGWRTNGRNLNLNRDYTKLETAGVRAVVKVITVWEPDLYVDLHVTDGTDYQYDITWGLPSRYGWSPAIGRWADERFASAMNNALEAWGHTPGRFVWPYEGEDLSKGILVWSGSPRFSDSYGSARHLPTILVENHSLKSYDRRVLGTYVFLKTAMEVLIGEKHELRKAVKTDRSARPDPLVLSWSEDDPPVTESVPFKGIRSENQESEVAGGEIVRWTGESYRGPIQFTYHSKPSATARRPKYYYIPAAWSDIADKLVLHGIIVERLSSSVNANVERIRAPEAGLDTGENGAFDQSSVIYEGRVRIKPGSLVTESDTLAIPAGSFRVSTDQALGDLVMLLLEPGSPDSLYQWGYFLETLSRTEYREAYVIEPMAREMLTKDPALRRAFEDRLASDPEFAADPERRLDWFYQQTPYYDRTYRLYPIMRSKE